MSTSLLGQDNIEKVNPLEERNKKAENIADEEELLDYILTDRLLPTQEQLRPHKDKLIKWGNLFKLVQDKKNYQGLANLFVPEILTASETLVSLIHFGIFGSPMFMRYRGHDSSDEASANAQTQLVFYQMDENKFRLQMNGFERQLVVFGTGIRKLVWSFDEREVTNINKDTLEPEKRLETTRDVWSFKWVDLLNFWIPPDTPWYDLQEAEWVAETYSVNRAWVKNAIRKKWISEKRGKELLEDVVSKKNYEDLSERLKELRLSSSEVSIYGQRKSNPYKIVEWYGLLPAKFVKDRDDNLEDDDLVLSICLLGNGIPLKVDKLINVYWHNQKPYVASSFIPLEGEFFGMGVAQVGESLQEELNDTRNQTMDNKTKILLNMWLKDAAAGIQNSQLQWRPDGVVTSRNMDGLKPLAPPIISGVGINLESIIKDDIRRSVAAVSGLQGVPQPGVGSATEFSGIQQSALGRSKLIVETVAESVLKPLFSMVKYLNYQFYDHSKLIKVIGKDGIKMRFLSPSEITGNYDIELELSTDFEKNPNVLRQQILTAFAQVAGLTPQQIQFHWSLLKKIFELLGIKNFEEMYPAPPSAIGSVLLTPEEELKVMLEGQAISVKPGEDHLQHLQEHTAIRQQIYLSAPPYIIDILDSHIRDHMAYIKQMQQQMILGSGVGLNPGQVPNMASSTMQAPVTDQEITKGVENI